MRALAPKIVCEDKKGSRLSRLLHRILTQRTYGTMCAMSPDESRAQRLFNESQLSAKRTCRNARAVKMAPKDLLEERRQQSVRSSHHSPMASRISTGRPFISDIGVDRRSLGL
jgi:hypothetical protein